ncbi:hypothetical protein JCM16303_000281 [Sporobolomyces ruberrimus]
MPPLPDTHPDGDPFAEQDKLRDQNSLIGKMEQRARLEAQQQGLDENGQHKKEDKKPRSTSTSLGLNKDGKELLVLDDSDDEPPSEGEAQATDGEEDDDDEDQSGQDEDDDEGEGDASSGQEGEGDERDTLEESRIEAGDIPGDDDEDDEDDSEDDDSEDDSASSVGTGEQGQDGDVSMADAQGDDPTKPRSPIKASASISTGDGSAAGGGAEGGGEPKKEKKKRRRRAANRSPSPPPLEPKKPPPTVRLTITLPPRTSKETPTYNVIEMAKEAGIIPREAPPKPEGENGGDESESDGQGGRRKKDKGKGKADGQGENGVAAGPPPKKRKRGPNVIVGRFGGYDVEDPFVDDTELQLYEPRHYYRPRREGYFVCLGPVECAPKRGGARRSRNPAGPKKIVIGPDGKPIPLDTPQAGSSNGRIETPFGTSGIPTFGTEPAKPARKPGEFSQELEENFEMLKVEADKESFEVKNKFPPHLKELLTSVAYRALDLDEYDEYFFARLPSIFPYNKFTLTKLVKREVFQKRMNDYTTRQEELLDVLREGIKDNLEDQKREFEENYGAWIKEKESGGATKVDGASAPPTPAAVSAIPAFGAAPVPMSDAPVGADGSPAPATDSAVPEEEKEPKFKFRYNDMMRSALYWVCQIEDQKSELIEEKQKLEKATTRDHNPEKAHNQKTARKAMYNKITSLWPEGVMQTNQISREISNYKLKLKKAGEIAPDA